MTPEQIKHMVDRFLSWKLPKDFWPDGGIEFHRIHSGHDGLPVPFEPVGTNLFTANQAESMVRHMLFGLPEGQITTDERTGEQPDRLQQFRDKMQFKADACRLNKSPDGQYLHNLFLELADILIEQRAQSPLPLRGEASPNAEGEGSMP